MLALLTRTDAPRYFVLYHVPTRIKLKKTAVLTISTMTRKKKGRFANPDPDLDPSFILVRPAVSTSLN